MEKVVLRVSMVRAASRFLFSKGKCKNLKEYVKKQGINNVLNIIFDEQKLNIVRLKEEYDRFVSGENSEIYAWMYKVNSEFGVVIDSHIYLYHFNPDFNKQTREILGWEYAESRRFLGDTWWFSDEEILKDLQEMSVVNFIHKYRGYDVIND